MVEPAIGIVLALALLGFAILALLEWADRNRTLRRAETFRRFAPQPVFAPALLVPVFAGAGAEADADEPLLRGRRDEFLSLGLDELEALDAAAEVDVDAFRSLVDRGCPPQLALEILR